MLNKTVQFVILLFLIILYLLNFQSGKISADFILLMLFIASISTFSFFVLRKENVNDLKKQYLQFSILFSVAFCIVHFQVYIDYLLGNIDESSSFIWIDVKIVNKSLLFSVVAIVCYYFGYSLKDRLKAAIPKTINDLKVLNVSSLLVLSSFFLILFFTFIDRRYFTGGYGKVDLGVAIYFALLFESCISAVLIINSRNLYIINQTKRKVTLNYFLNYNKIVFLLMLIYLAAVLFSGDRGPIIYNVLFIAISFAFSTRTKIRPAYLTILIGTGAVIITILGTVRRTENSLSFVDNVSNNLTIDTDVNHYPSSFFNATRELAFSARCMNLAVDAKESGLESTLGIFAVQDIMLLIPGLKGYFITFFDIPMPLTSSPQFLTFYDRGAFSSWGAGTSCVADTYLDFGFIGIITIFILVGFLVRKIEIKCFTANQIPPFYAIIVLFCIFSYSVYIPRSTLLYSLNKFMYIYAMIFICQIINKRKFN